jgi:DNA modification methylase
MIVNASSHNMPLAPQSVNCIVTSPPYFGLRAYSGNQLVDWPAGLYSPMAGVPACVSVPGYRDYDEYRQCAHEWMDESFVRRSNDGGKSAKQASNNGANGRDVPTQVKYCAKCGAMRCGLGAEPTPEAYVWHMLLVLRECYRVLRDDGVMWLNLGDSYANDDKWGGATGGKHVQGLHGEPGCRARTHTGLSGGNLMLIPERVLMAAQADGWTVRNTVTWHKSSTMPESVKGWRWEAKRCDCITSSRGNEDYRAGAFGHRPNRDHDPENPKEFAKAQAIPDCPKCHGTGRTDEMVLRQGAWRHTRATEPVYMLTKGMDYWCDHIAVQEAAEYDGRKDEQMKGSSELGDNEYRASDSKNNSMAKHGAPRWNKDENGTRVRNPRNVIKCATAQYKGSHYATFPVELIAPLVKSSTPRKVCPHCGQPWAPVTDTPAIPDELRNRGNGAKMDFHTRQTGSGQKMQDWRDANPTKLNGYRPTCECVYKPKWSDEVFDLGNGKKFRLDESFTPQQFDAGEGWHARAWFTDEPEPQNLHYPPTAGVLLDPFAGSGTSGQVAREWGVRFIGLDISHEYLHDHAMIRAERTMPQAHIDALPIFANEGN